MTPLSMFWTVCVHWKLCTHYSTKFPIKKWNIISKKTLPFVKKINKKDDIFISNTFSLCWKVSKCTTLQSSELSVVPLNRNIKTGIWQMSAPKGMHSAAQVALENCESPKGGSQRLIETFSKELYMRRVSNKETGLQWNPPF